MRVLVLGLALLSAACATVRIDASPGRTSLQGVTLQTSRLEVEQGGDIGLTLLNGSDRTVEMGVFGCAVIQRWDGVDWAVHEEDNDRSCIQLLVVVQPGRRYEGGFGFDVAPGRVRLVHRFNFLGESHSESLVTPAIRVTG